MIVALAEAPPTRDANRDSGTDRANGGWPRRLLGVKLLLALLGLALGIPMWR